MCIVIGHIIYTCLPFCKVKYWLIRSDISLSYSLIMHPPIYTYFLPWIGWRRGITGAGKTGLSSVITIPMLLHSNISYFSVYYYSFCLIFLYCFLPRASPHCDIPYYHATLLILKCGHPALLSCYNNNTTQLTAEIFLRLVVLSSSSTSWKQSWTYCRIWMLLNMSRQINHQCVYL